MKSLLSAAFRLTLAALLGLASRPVLAAEIDFAHDVAPVVKQYCGKCHTGTQKKGGLSINSRESLMSGGESGPAIDLKTPASSEFLLRIESSDPDLKMPPEGESIPAEKIALLKAWVSAGAKWEDGFTFGKRLYEPPLRPRRPELPPSSGRDNPIDRIIDADLVERGAPLPKPIDDATFARRVYFDLIGLPPTPEELERFLADQGRDKRDRLIRELLGRDVDYAEHWLTFWNDLLRNDYTGTGFITGGRKQITKWLYKALVDNLHYDEFARQLIDPQTLDSQGFIDGIQWRGEVSAGQSVEVQFAQSVAQSFLGINLKCASCHDSFVDRWTLEEAYGLAAIYSKRDLEIHRCDKPVGKIGKASWLFPELGQVDPKAEQHVRLEQLARLMTHPENGRFTRTIVNRLWHRLMGRGIVHPTDAMQTEPWNADLLDYLAVDLADHKYDLKRTLYLIASSAAYQSQTQIVTPGVDDKGYVYAGPRAKRLTAEQFVDAVWRLTGAGPTRIDAPIIRGRATSAAADIEPQGKWIWNRQDARNSPVGESARFRRKFELPADPVAVAAAISCDNSYTLFVNRKKVDASDNWMELTTQLEPTAFKKGANELLIDGANGGASPNPVGLYCEIILTMKDGSTVRIASDEKFEWTDAKADVKTPTAMDKADWKPAVVVNHAGVWNGHLGPKIAAKLAERRLGADAMVRASLVKSDFLMRTLGRPNRDQIVSVRPDELSTLEAIDLSNGEILAGQLFNGAKKLAAQEDLSPEQLVQRLFVSALGRDPSADEEKTLVQLVGSPVDARGVQDVLWALVLHPEFLIVR